MKKRIVELLIMCVFIIGLFSGFTTMKQAVGGKLNDYGWISPYKTLDFTYYSKGQSDPVKVKKNCDILQKYILDNFNVNVNKVVYNTNADERFNLLLASGDYPGVIRGLTSADVAKMKDLGKVVDLTPYMDKDGKNIKKGLGATYGRYLDSDKKLYALPYGWGMLAIPDYSAHIRLDWYKEIGSPKFQTPDEYYNVLKKMIAKHPKNASGKKVYALSWDKDNCTLESVLGIWGLKEGYKEDANHNLTHWINTPEGLEMAKFYNKVYRDGLLDPDAFSNTFDQWKEKFSDQRIAGHIGAWWETWNAGHEVWQKLDKNWKEDQRYVQVELKAKGVKKAYLSPKDTMGWGYTVITDKCKDIEGTLKFMDWMTTPNGTRLLAYGVPNLPGSNWNFKNGKWSFTESAKQDVINSTYDYDKHYLLGQNQYWLDYSQGSMPDAPKANAWIDQCFNDEAKWKKLMDDNLKDSIYDFTAFEEVQFLPDDQITITKQQVTDAVNTYFAKTVLSKTEAEFNANYAIMKDKLVKAGVNDLQKYYTEQYKKNLKNWGMK